MKKLFLAFLIVGALLPLKATHNRSGEILYTRIAPFGNIWGPVYTYSITLITYTDDGESIADRCKDTLYFGDGQHAVVQRVNNVPVANASGCGCGAGIGCGEIIVNLVNYRVKKNIFTVIHTYSGTGIYVISMTDLNRNAGIVNIPNSVNTPFYIESQIVVAAWTNNNTSPAPTNPPADQGHVNSCYYHNPFAFDADGDSLSYELAPCQNAPGFTFPGAGTNGNLSVNNTGLLTWCNPQAIGEYNLVIKIKEWRRPSCGEAYQMIGYVSRDMQIVINGPGANVSFSTGPLSDTCIAAGSVFTRTLLASPSDSFVAMKVLGSCINTQPAAAITPTAYSNTSTLTWQVPCHLAQRQPYAVDLVYLTYGSAQYLYRPFNLKIVPPAVQIYDTQKDTGVITIKWHTPTACAGNLWGYNVYRKAGAASWTHGACETGVPASSGFNMVFTALPGDTSFTDIYLQPYANGSTINYIVTAVTDDCQEGFAENTQTVSVLVGIKQVASDFPVSIFPNPFDDTFEIQLGAQPVSELQTTLYASDGRQIYTRSDQAVTSVSILNPDLKPGLYLLQLKTPKGSVYKKLIKDQ